MVGRPGRGSAERRRFSPAGYTLVELLTVLAIVAALAAMGIGAIAALPTRYAHEQAASTLKALLRRARTLALNRRLPTTLVRDGQDLAITSWRTRLLLRFEDLGQMPSDLELFWGDGSAGASSEHDASAGDGTTRGSGEGAEVAGDGEDADETDETGAGAPRIEAGSTAGARSQRARVSRVTVDAGRFGQAVFFEEPGAHVDLGPDPALVSARGVRLRIWVRPDRLTERDLRRRPPPPGGADDDLREFQIAGKGDTLQLRMLETYALWASVRGEESGRGAERESRRGALQPGRWAEVVLVYDGQDLAIFVDGLRVDDPPPEDAPAVPPSLKADPAPLYLSSPEPGLSFLGGMDEVRIDGLVDVERVRLPKSVEIRGPLRVWFDADGALDPRHHDARVRFSVQLSGGPGEGAGMKKERVVEVGRSGALW